MCTWQIMCACMGGWPIVFKKAFLVFYFLSKIRKFDQKPAEENEVGFN